MMALLGSLTQAQIEAEYDGGRAPFVHCPKCERELGHRRMPVNARASIGGIVVSCCSCRVPLPATTEIVFLTAAESGWRIDEVDHGPIQ